MNGWMLLLLSAQAVLAVAGLTLFKVSVLPVLGPGRRSELIVDVWGPIALAAPFLVAALAVDGAVDGSMAGMGWIVVGGPVCIGSFVAGATLLVGPLPAVLPFPGRLVLGLGGAGVVVLLLAAAHDLTIWTGQVVFAAAAVLLWMNSPAAPAGGWPEENDAPAAGLPGSPDGRPRPGPRVALALMVVLALGQGVCVLWAPGPLSALLLVGYGFGAGILAAGTRGAAPAARMGGWTAALGSLLGIGTISVAHLMPQAAGIVLGRDVEVRTHVAHSFGIFWLDGAVLLALAAALWLAPAFNDVARRGLGFILIASAAALAAGRLTDVWMAG